MLAHFSLLGIFFSLLGASCAFLGRFWLALVVFPAFWIVLGWILGRSGTQETPLGIHLSFSFPTCSAAVRAQHMELAILASKLYEVCPFGLS